MTRDFLDPNGIRPQQNSRDVRDYVLMRDGGVNETVRKLYLIKLPADRDSVSCRRMHMDALLSEGSDRFSLLDKTKCLEMSGNFHG